MKAFVFYLLAILMLAGCSSPETKEIILQEGDTGFCYVDGGMETGTKGFTGEGYINPESGIGVSSSWSIKSPQSTKAIITWRYANGGGSGDRFAALYVNGELAQDSVNFVHTGKWGDWQELDSIEIPLKSGYNEIKILSQSADGLANIDYFKAKGPGISAVSCTPSYTLEVGKLGMGEGKVSFQPEQLFYKAGTEVTVKATPGEGYFLESWTGDATSDQATYTFEIAENTVMKARFLPEGTTMAPEAAGYATVQDDKGTPYMLTGGSLGDTVKADSYESLKSYLESEKPYVVQVSSKIGKKDPEGQPTSDKVLKVQSNKTLLGDGAHAHLVDIEVDISTDVRNVVIQGMKFSHVAPKDAMLINGAKNIWIDQCEFFSDMDHGKDYYDGLLDIKNESSFVTVSRNNFHDHMKSVLISSGDDSNQDTVQRVTFYYNVFHNIGARLPSIRFGKAHIFNNYYKDVHISAISSRMGACSRIEGNYFENVATPIKLEQSREPGYIQMIGNHIDAEEEGQVSCELEVPYDYSSLLIDAGKVPGLFKDIAL